MAHYNAWQNRSLVAAAETLEDAARWQDRGAFFGSIARTFHHLLWDDALWLARFAGNPRPEESVPVSLDYPSDWAAFKAERLVRDSEITAWAAALGPADLQGSVLWYPAGGTVPIEKPRALCAMHFFNHQTHHRGQIHAMLTAAGAWPEPTDLPMLSEDET
jgi:uncharacterized damage-inducible protein DinB